MWSRAAGEADSAGEGNAGNSTYQSRPHSLRDEFRIPKDNSRFRIVHADGAEYVERAVGEIDVILLDAYDKIGIPTRLTTRRFAEDARRSLSSRGMLVVNLAGVGGDYARAVANISDVFEGRVLVVTVRRDGNQVLFAFSAELYPLEWSLVRSAAEGMRDRLGLDFPSFARKLERAATSDLSTRRERRESGATGSF